MKKLLFVLALVAGITTINAQEGVYMKKSTTLRLDEVPPTWPGCTGSINDKNNCLRQKLATHVVRNMKFPSDYQKGARVVVDMVINKEGKPVINNVTGGTPGMQKAVKTAIMTIPQLKPGNIGGTPKESKLKLPFTF
ncbi:energy transducer TonB [Dokdonia sp. Asnod1-B02]|uniref:energy transducer TonB n=1 Tax=Dokdonia sp. Asnod1-B02 TaxID=3160573 RepID=UPI0038639C57